jgi:bacterioferritin-associated ferredoxin
MAEPGDIEGAGDDGFTRCFLDLFQVEQQFGIARKGVFLFCEGQCGSLSMIGDPRKMGEKPRKLVHSMIVCSCNVITDHDVRNVVTTADELPRNPKQVYGCLGCSPECGRCARTIKTIIDEALGPCARACMSGCRHSHDAHTHADTSNDPDTAEFALAAY